MSHLLDNDLYFRILLIFMILLALVAAVFILRRGITFPLYIPQSSALAPKATSTDSQSIISQPNGGIDTAPAASYQPTPPGVENALSTYLLTPIDLNAVLDIWSTDTISILPKTLQEYSLTDAAGLSYVSRSRDIGLSIEMYQFSDDNGLVRNVFTALKDIYLRDLGYQSTSKDCTPNFDQSNWILVDAPGTHMLLGKVYTPFYINIMVSSETPLDTENFSFLLCEILEKQLESLQAAGY